MKKFKLVVLLVLALAGCGKKPETPMINSERSITKDELQFRVAQELKVLPIVPDNRYRLFKKIKVKDFYYFYEKELFELGIVKSSQSFDCNRFSQFYAALAQVLASKYFWKDEAIAVGEVYYTKDSGESHAINLIYTDFGMVLIEPQTGEETILSIKEKNSIRFIKF